MSDATPDLTSDELTVLSLAAMGVSVAATAHWEIPVNRLASLGLLQRHDQFNHTITASGRVRWDGLEADEDAAILGALKAVERGA